MKKNLFVLGVAVAALASCTNEEVMEVAENRAIGFNTFVGNNTKAVTTVTDEGANALTGFYVFGNYSKDSQWSTLFDNIKVEGSTVGTSSEWTPVDEAYWQPRCDHVFAAYANGNGGDLGDAVSFTPASDGSHKLNFTSYAASTQQKDLIVAVPALVGSATVTTGYEAKVGLEFYHMLSIVRFTFTTNDVQTYTLKISDMSISGSTADNNPAITASGSATYKVTEGPTIVWDATAGTKGTYTVGEIADVADDDQTASTDCFVIPQESTNNFIVTFTATLIDDQNNTVGTGKFTAPLTYNTSEDITSLETGTTANTWTQGFIYNYTATINGSMLDDEDGNELKPIKFEVTAVEDWNEATDMPVTTTEKTN